MVAAAPPTVTLVISPYWPFVSTTVFPPEYGPLFVDSA